MISTILDTVRRLVGRRSRISREEAVRLLTELHEAGLTDLDDDWHGGPYDARSGATAARSAAAWVDRVRDIIVVSVVPWRDGPAEVRYDTPGSMAPMMQAELMLCTDSINDLDYLRRRCGRLLVLEEPRQ